MSISFVSLSFYKILVELYNLERSSHSWSTRHSETQRGPPVLRCWLYLEVQCGLRNNWVTASASNKGMEGKQQKEHALSRLVLIPAPAKRYYYPRFTSWENWAIKNLYKWIRGGDEICRDSQNLLSLTPIQASMCFWPPLRTHSSNRLFLYWPSWVLKTQGSKGLKEQI